MDQQRRAEYEACREEIQAWKQEQIKALREAVSAGMPPSFAAPPPRTNDTYKRVIRMIREDSAGAFTSQPSKDLTIVSADTVIEAIDLLLAATRSQ